nr:hypothetical protein [Tanacetum cinerariifolium]
MRCTSNDLDKLTYDTYFLDHYKKKHIVFGCLLQRTIRGCINIQEFASSPDSNTLDLNFLPYNAKVLACSEQGIMVFKSPNLKFNMKDLYHICKPTTRQVLPLPNPKTKYTKQKVAIVVKSMNPLRYKIVRLSEPKNPVLQTKDKKRYSTHRVEIFDSNKWVWSPLPDLVKLPFCVSLTNPQPITTRGSIYMLLTNGDILRVDAYSATWEILTPPAPTLKCDQAGILKQLVKYSGKLRFAFKPPNGC